ELLVDEWSVGVYHRELALPVPVNAVCANVTYGNGVLLVALPISDQTSPARLTLERVTPTHGEHKGNAGHPVTCVQTRLHGHICSLELTTLRWGKPVQAS